MLRRSNVIAILVLIAVSMPAHSESLTAHRVKVTIVRQESSVHTSLENRDAYLVRVIPKSGKAFFARIVDQYPADSDRPQLSLVIDQARISAALRRTPYCDGVDEETGGLLRCFQVVHGSWRLPKASAEGQWWK